MRYLKWLPVILLLSSCTTGEEIPESTPPLRFVEYPAVQLSLEHQRRIKEKIGSLYEDVVCRDVTEGGYLYSPSIDALVAEGASAMPFIVEEYNKLYKSLTPNFGKRYVLLEVARRIASRRHLEFFCWVLHNGDAYERAVAAKALLEFGKMSCVPALIHALGDENREVIWRSAAALRRITGNDFGLRKEINDEDFETAIHRWRMWFYDCYIRQSQR